VVVVESEKRYQLVRQLIETLKNAAKGRSTGTRAVILVVQFPGSTPTPCLSSRVTTQLIARRPHRFSSPLVLSFPALALLTFTPSSAVRRVRWDQRRSWASRSRARVLFREPIESERWRPVIASVCNRPDVMASEGPGVHRPHSRVACVPAGNVTGLFW